MIFSSLKIKNVELKNRIVMSPMCTYMAKNDGKVNDWHIVHYAARAVGGVGLIIPEATAISLNGRISKNDLGLWNDNQIEGFKKLVSTIHQLGSKVAVQLAHAGRKSEADGRLIAPSAIAFSSDFETPEETTVEDIERIADRFYSAANRAIAAGVDIIEIHAAHGYFINQMLSPLTNKRTDLYGGSFENRNRFLIEVIKRIRKIWDGPLFIRVSADEYVEGGNHIEQTIETVKLIADNIDLIDVSSGGVTPDMPKTYPGYQAIFSKKIKNANNILTGAVGLITTDEYAEALLNDGSADLIFMGRELLRNPYWAIYAADKQEIALYPKPYKRAFYSV